MNISTQYRDLEDLMIRYNGMADSRVKEDYTTVLKTLCCAHDFFFSVDKYMFYLDSENGTIQRCSGQDFCIPCFLEKPTKAYPGVTPFSLTPQKPEYQFMYFFVEKRDAKAPHTLVEIKGYVSSLKASYMATNNGNTKDFIWTVLTKEQLTKKYGPCRLDEETGCVVPKRRVKQSAQPTSYAYIEYVRSGQKLGFQCDERHMDAAIENVLSWNDTELVGIELRDTYSRVASTWRPHFTGSGGNIV